MAEGSLARRYARALLALGQEAEQVDVFADNLAAFTEALNLNDQLLHHVLTNPGLTVAERRAVLQSVLEKMSLSPMVNNFLNLLVDKSRLVIFDQIQFAYQEMADALSGRVRATVTTASALHPSESTHIASVLSKAIGRTVVVDYQVDEALIGGIVARVGDTVFDASIRTRLQDMREILSR